MRRLAIVQHFVAPGGLTRFMDELVASLLSSPEAQDWDITLFTPERDARGKLVDWSPHIGHLRFHLRCLQQDRWATRIADMTGGGRWFRIPGTGRLRQRLASLLMRVPYPTSTRRRIERILRRERFDVAYFPYPYQMACPRVSTPLVITVHDFNYKRFDTVAPAVRRRVEREMPDWLERSCHIIVSTEFMASELRHFHPGYEDKTSVVRLAIPGRDRPSDGEVRAFRERVGLPERFILTTGWIVPHKNQAVVLNALPHLRKEGIELPLVCTGPNSHELRSAARASSSYIQNIFDLCRHNDLVYERDVWALGFVDEADLECLYRLATVLVVPSLYEAGSFSGAEAMRAGCPVILSDIPAHAEQLAGAAGNGWTFDPRSPSHLASIIQEVTRDPERTAAIARAAAARVRLTYSWTATAAGYAKVLLQCTRTP